MTDKQYEFCTQIGNRLGVEIPHKDTPYVDADIFIKQHLEKYNNETPKEHDGREIDNEYGFSVYDLLD